jgi:hypothetical protein
MRDFATYFLVGSRNEISYMKMNDKYQMLYSEMLKDIERSQGVALPEEDRVASGFWIAHNYWERLKSLMANSSFKDDAEEIDFFRNVKPQFTSPIEYFTILSEALVCVPRTNLTAFNFWDGESKRYDRYCERNQVFIEYLESGDHTKDCQYFLKRNSGLTFVPKAPVFDVDPEFCTSHDHLVRGWLAQKRYQEYCLNKLEDLARGKELKEKKEQNKEK